MFLISQKPCFVKESKIGLFLLFTAGKTLFLVGALKKPSQKKRLLAYKGHLKEERRRDALTVCVHCKGRESENGNVLVLCDGDDMCPGAKHQRCMEDAKWHKATAKQMQGWSWVCPAHE